MLCREIIAVCSEIHTKHINTVCGLNVELLNVKLVVNIVTTGLIKFKSLPNRRIHHRCEFVSLTLCKRCITKNLKAGDSFVEFEAFALLRRYTAWIGS
jgi:hypothetical protein